MSMFDDVLGFGRSSIFESMMGEFEPELEETTLESVEALGEGVDPMDFILQVAYENEMNMKNLDIAIMAEEYVYLRENGQEMVYEDTKIQSVIEKFKSATKWLWEQIQKFFKTAMKKFDEILKLDDRFLEKYEKKAAGKTTMINGWELDYLDCDEIADSGKEYIDKIRTLSDKVFDELVKNDSTVKYDDVKELLVDKETGKGPKELFRATIKVSKKDLKKNRSYDANTAIKYFKASKKAKASLKEYYNENKKVINSQIKTAKKMESVAKKARIIPTETSKAIHTTVKTLNKFGSLLTLVDRTYIKVINMARAQLKAIIVSAAAKDNANSKSSGSDVEVVDTKSSSTTLAVRGESTSFVDMVEFGMTF